jgi:hypothetical protein
MLLSNLLKTAGAAAVIAIGVGASSSASAATTETRCYGGDCYRMVCNDWGYNCRRMDYMGRVGYVRPRDRLVCDADGDDCHWMSTRVYRGHYDYDYNYDNDYYGDDYYGD